MIKHKILKDFTFANTEKKVFILKSNSMLENYIYAVSKSEKILIDKDLVDTNPDFFKPLDWREELTIYVKSQKIPQPAQIVKKIIPFIDETLATYAPQNIGKVDNSVEFNKKISEYDIKIKDLEIKSQEYNQSIEDFSTQKRKIEQEKLNLELDLKKKHSQLLEDISEQKREFEKKYDDLEKSLRNEYREKNQGLSSLGVDQDKKIRDLETEIELRSQSLSSRELDLDQRERKISYKEEEMDLRLKKLEQRENDHKEDLIKLDSKEESLRKEFIKIQKMENDHQSKLSDLLERERNIDLHSLSSTQAIDKKYGEMQEKMKKESQELSKREKELEKKALSSQNILQNLDDQKSKLDDEIRDWTIKKEEISRWQDDIKRLDNEIKAWEGIHWKMRRNTPPPSAIL